MTEASSPERQGYDSWDHIAMLCRELIGNEKPDLQPVSPDLGCEDLTLLRPALEPYTHLWKSPVYEQSREARAFNDDASRLIADFESERDWQTPTGRIVTALSKKMRTMRGSPSASYELSSYTSGKRSTIHDGPNDWGQDIALRSVAYQGYLRIGDQEFNFDQNDPLIKLNIAAAIDYHASPSYFEAAILPAQRRIVVLRETDRELPGIGFSPNVNLLASVENVLAAVSESSPGDGNQKTES